MSELNTELEAITELFVAENAKNKADADQGAGAAAASEVKTEETTTPAPGANEPDPPAPNTPEDDMLAKLFPKTPAASLAPWVVAADRKIKRLCQLIDEPEDMMFCAFFAVTS